MNAPNKTLVKSSSLLLTFFLAFIMAGCQKEQLPIPGSSSYSEALGNEKLSRPEIRPNEIIRIDHQAARSFLPDYMVSLYDNGTVVFYGRKNVANYGKVTYRISESTMQEFSQIVKATDFFNISDTLTYQQDRPLTITTFSFPIHPAGEPWFDSAAKSLIDYNGTYPEALIGMRVKVERLLKTSELIGRHTDFAIPETKRSF